MRLQQLCEMDLRYTSPFKIVIPYGGDGSGWGIGEGSVKGERLSGTAQWSNHPRRRGDGAMLPNARGVITADDGAEIFFELSGRTVWVERDRALRGAQLLMTLFESQAEAYTWLNNTVCMSEGKIDPSTLVLALRVFSCENELF